jgi:uncharacterized protein with LGFP repeats
MGIIRRIFFVLFSLTLLPVLAGTTSRGYAQTTTEWVCEETGFTVRGEFLEFYRSTNNELELFGYPITGQIVDGMGHRVQYFQKARFDFDETTGLVHSAPIGTYLYTAGEYKVADIGGDSSLCRVFSNGHTVCYAFLQFYDAKKGANYLGMPISDTEINAAGYLTQFFENGVLEWHPERGTGQRVVVADMGRIYYERTVGFLPQPPGNNIFNTPRIPQVDVFTSKAIVSANSSEEIFVIVKDQYQHPLSNAKISIVMTLPDGTEEQTSAIYTNADGIAKINISIGNFEPRDVVNIKATATVDQESASAKTWFRVWW